MTEPVTEHAGERGPVHDTPGGRVRIAAPDSCAQGVEARLLRGEHEGVGLLDRPFDEPGREGPGVVGRVAADNAAGIHDHCLAATDLAIGGTAVWARRVRA